MHIKKYLITGLLVWLPLAITVWVMLWLVGLLDGIFAGVLSGLEAVPARWPEPDDRAPAHHPGLGVILVFLTLLFTGALVSNVAGRWWVRQWDRLFANIPIFKSIYNSVKKVSTPCSPATARRFARPC
jgi:uncharacterized membrane protein